ncbi:hypothetical protein V6N13_081242 [Hibiscus sabdariffa]
MGGERQPCFDVDRTFGGGEAVDVAFIDRTTMNLPMINGLYGDGMARTSGQERSRGESTWHLTINGWVARRSQEPRWSNAWAHAGGESAAAI